MEINIDSVCSPMLQSVLHYGVVTGSKASKTSVAGESDLDLVMVANFSARKEKFPPTSYMRRTGKSENGVLIDARIFSLSEFVVRGSHGDTDVIRALFEQDYALHFVQPTMAILSMMKDRKGFLPAAAKGFQGEYKRYKSLSRRRIYPADSKPDARYKSLRNLYQYKALKALADLLSILAYDRLTDEFSSILMDVRTGKFSSFEFEKLCDYYEYDVDTALRKLPTTIEEKSISILQNLHLMCRRIEA